MRALRPPPGGSPAPAPSPSTYQPPAPSPRAAFQGGIISSPPSPSAVGSPGPAPVPAPAPEPNAVLPFAGGARRGGAGGMSPPLIAMLAVVGAALLVVLYARLARRVSRTVRRRWRGWQRRRRLLLITLAGGGAGSSSPANDSFASFTTYDNFYHTFSPYGLDDAAIKSLPSAQFLLSAAPARASAGARDCAVCLLEFADGDELRALPLCAHAFHADCVDVWLRAHASCPLCRAAVALPAPVASPLRSARRVRPSLDDLLFFHPVPQQQPPVALAPDALHEITPASPDRQLNPRDFLLKRSYSFGFERSIATEAASTASPTWRYRLGGDGRGRSFWSKRWPSPFGGSAAAARVFSFRSAAAAGKSSPFARRRAAAPAGASGFFMTLSSEPPSMLVAGRRSNRASSRLRCGDPEALLSPDRLSR